MNTDSAKQDVKDAAHKASHSAAADQAKGKSEQLIGKVKEKVGNLIGDDEMAAKGTVQRAEGKKDELKGDIKEKIEDAKDKVKAGAEVIKEKFQEARSKT